MHIFSDEVLDTSLLSISELCNNSCIATFSKNNVHVTKDGNTVFNSEKEPSESLWHVNIPACQDALAGSATLRSDTDEALTMFIHTSFGSTALSTFLLAVRKGFLAAYPRLTPAMLSAYLTLTAATARGHLDQHRQGLDSTASDELDNNETNTGSQPTSRRTAFTKVIPLSHTAHSDLTGRFPIKAASGAEFIFISVLDGYIHCVPMTSRHQTSYISAYKSTLSFWDALGHKPLYQRLDNETSSALEQYATKNNVSIQYCPPGQHRSLKGERAIRTFKNHFISTLCTVSLNFPLNLWDKLLPQAELCLNHLIPYGPNPHTSAYEGRHGCKFDFRGHPIAPAGSKVLIHDKPSARGSWAPHGVLGFYLGPSKHHYRCFDVWSVETQSIRITDTVAWLLEKVSLPNIGPHDKALAAIKDLTTALDSLAKTAPAIVRQRQLHIQPTSLSSDLMQFLASFYPPFTTDSSDSPTSSLPAKEPHSLPHPAPDQRVLITQEHTTVTHNPESVEQTPSPPPEQRVASMQQQTDTKTQIVIPPIVHDVAAIAPASHIPQSSPPLTLQGTPPENFIAPNVPFPKTSTRAKTRPTPPLTRSRTTAHAAATTASLNLAPMGHN